MEAARSGVGAEHRAYPPTITIITPPSFNTQPCGTSPVKKGGERGKGRGEGKHTPTPNTIQLGAPSTGRHTDHASVALTPPPASPRHARRNS